MQSTVLGYPRIGANRELKKAVEAYWAGKIDASALASTAIDALDADVTSIEASRSKMEILGDLAAIGYGRGVGPGVWDIHSPRVPSQEEVVSSLRRAVAAVPARRLWVNPDCGLKTRGYAEVEASLKHLVAAAVEVRGN